jgi:hypothetical protein
MEAGWRGQADPSGQLWQVREDLRDKRGVGGSGARVCRDMLIAGLVGVGRLCQLTIIAESRQPCRIDPG